MSTLADIDVQLCRGIIAVLCLLAVALLMTLVTSRHIARLDIVEGLKAQDE